MTTPRKAKPAKTLARAVANKNAERADDLLRTSYELKFAMRVIDRLEVELAAAKERIADLECRAAKAYGAMEMAEKITGVLR